MFYINVKQCKAIHSQIKKVHECISDVDTNIYLNLRYRLLVICELHGIFVKRLRLP